MDDQHLKFNTEYILLHSSLMFNNFFLYFILEPYYSESDSTLLNCKAKV